MSDVFAPGLPDQLAEIWDLRPHVFRNVMSTPMLTAADFMTGVVGAATDYVADHRKRYGRVFAGGEAVHPPALQQFMPSDPHESIDAYVDRIARAHGDFTVVLLACERYLPHVRERFVRLLHQLFARVGYPVLPNHGCIYSGTYRTTPFGIHIDPCHVLMCCGVGKKRLAFWPKSYFEPMQELFVENPDGQGKMRVEVADHLAHATVLEVGPHDLLYWPADMWHVGLSESGEFHASISMGIYHRASTAQMFTSLDFMPPQMTHVSQTDQYRLLDLHGFGPSLISSGTLTTDQLWSTPLAAFRDYWNRARDQLSKPGEVDYRMLQVVLSSLTSAGFGPPRAPVARTVVGRGDALHCTVPESLLAARARDSVLVGANGQVFVYRTDLDAVETAVADLRRGGARPYDAIAVGDAPETIRLLIQDLVDAGAIAVCGRDAATALDTVRCATPANA